MYKTLTLNMMQNSIVHQTEIHLFLLLGNVSKFEWILKTRTVTFEQEFKIGISDICLFP